MLEGPQLVELVLKRAAEHRSDMKHFVPGWSFLVESQLRLSLRTNRHGLLSHAERLPPILIDHLDTVRRLMGDPIDLSDGVISRLADGYVRPRVQFRNSGCWKLTPETPLPTQRLSRAIARRLEASQAPTTPVPWASIVFALHSCDVAGAKAALLLRVASWEFQSREAVWRRLQQLPNRRAILESALNGPYRDNAAYFLAQDFLDNNEAAVPEPLWKHFEGFVARGALKDRPLDERLFRAIPTELARQALAPGGTRNNRRLLEALGLATSLRQTPKQPEVLRHALLGGMPWDEEMEAFVGQIELSLGGAPQSVEFHLTEASEEQVALATHLIDGGATSRWPSVLARAVRYGDVSGPRAFESRLAHLEIVVFSGRRWSFQAFLAPKDGREVDTRRDNPLEFDFLEEEG